MKNQFTPFLFCSFYLFFSKFNSSSFTKFSLIKTHRTLTFDTFPCDKAIEVVPFETLDYTDTYLGAYTGSKFNPNFQICSDSSTKYGREAVSYTHLDVYKRQFGKSIILIKNNFKTNKTMNNKGCFGIGTAGLVILGILAIVGFWAFGAYNGLVAGNNEVQKKWANVETVSYTHLDVYKKQL